MKTKSLFRIYSQFSVTIILIVFCSCNTNDPISYATVKDFDGNEYHTVKLGTQTWMVENLKSTKYNDGTAIPVISDNTAWLKLSTGACCIYNNDDANDAKYGKLYNWYAVNTGKLAPIGWHVPTDTEWTTLENYISANVGTSSSVAKALAAKTDWSTTTKYGAIGTDLSKNNYSGFSALPGGWRNYDYTDSFVFVDKGDYGYWWSSTSYIQFPNVSGYWSLSYGSSGGFYSDGQPNRMGLSVRCIKD